MPRVLIVDDSAIVRKIISAGLSKAADIEVVGTATDPYDARDKILSLKPDVLTLDINMPRMDGLSFLKKLMKFKPMPVVVVSSVAKEDSKIGMKALELGAVEVVGKSGAAHSTPEDIERNLTRAVRAAARAHVGGAAPRLGESNGAVQPVRFQQSDRLLAIGASTGGTRAIQSLLEGLPSNIPPTLIVQHMPATFTASFANSLDKACPCDVREAVDRQELEPGLALVAPGGLHMILNQSGNKLFVSLKDGPPVHYQRPAVDVLFKSVARIKGPKAVGTILTGMGADGAAGLLEMRQAGAHTIAQDEASCVVYGMPREAAKLDAAVEVLPLDKIALATIRALGGRIAQPQG